MAGQCHYACHLYSCLLSSRSVCRFCYQYLLFVGWNLWLRHTPDKGEKPVSGTPSKLLLPMFVVLLVVFVLIGIILETCTDSTVPWWDSFTTALSIIAMWMLAHKYVEQWLAWLVVDAVSCGIYIYKDLYFTSFLYGLYAVIACFGYLKWKQLMNLSYERV